MFTYHPRKRSPARIALRSTFCTALALFALDCGLHVSVAGQTATDEVLLDDFEGRPTVGSWTFYNGAEFPGASGSLYLGAGHVGAGAALAYKISCKNPGDYTTCGAYVGAWKDIMSKAIAPLLNPAAELWANASPILRVTVRVQDGSGQVFQYLVDPDFEHLGANLWNRFTTQALFPVTYWGGQKDGQFHGNLRAIQVLAADPELRPTDGTLRFDDVSWITNVQSAATMSSFMLDPTTIKLIPAPLAAAALQPRLGVVMHFATDGTAPDGRVLDIVRSAGFSFVRTDLVWTKVEKSAGQYDFSVYDKILAALEARGMGALFIIDYGHTEHSPVSNYPWTPLREEDVAAYARYAQAAAAHFRGHNVRYEIWNEPNIPAFWKPTPDAGQYAVLAKAALPAVRRGDPNAQVATGGISNGLDFLRGMLAADAQLGYDAIGVHPYRPSAPESATTYLWAATGLLDAYTGQSSTTVAGL